MVSPSSSSARLYRVSPAELEVFIQHVDPSSLHQRVKDIYDIAKKAFDGSIYAVFNEQQWRAFKQLEKEMLGGHVLETTFRDQMGIEPGGALTAPRNWQCDLVAFKHLLTPLLNLTDPKAKEIFLGLEKFQQKVLLKALVHFTETEETFRASRKGMSNHEMIILHSLQPILNKVAGGRFPSGDVKKDAYHFFKLFYPAYKGGSPTFEEIGQASLADKFLEQWREVPNPSLSYPFDQQPLSLLKKRDLYLRGDRQIGGDLKNEFRKLSLAFADLKVRFGRSDPSALKDLLRFFGTVRVAVAKGEAEVALYKPFFGDADLVFLEAKALANLAGLTYLESMTLKLMEEQGGTSPLQEPGRTPLQVSLNGDILLADAMRLARRADLMGHPKGGVLLSKLMRLKAGTALTLKDYNWAVEALQKGLGAQDREALLEAGRLQSAAWLSGIGDVPEESAIDIFKSLEKEGADGLREHFEAGSKKAGEALIELMSQRLESETLKAKFEQFVQWVFNLFSFGSASILGEEPFLSKDPHRFSSAEIDFLVKARLLGLEGASQLIDQALKQGRGPKVPLEQAHSFLKNLKKPQDPEMIVNGRRAYRYMQFAAETLLASRRWVEEHANFGNNSLTPYLESVDTESQAFEVLEPLLHELLYRLAPYEEPEEADVDTSSLATSFSNGGEEDQVEEESGKTWWDRLVALVENLAPISESHESQEEDARGIVTERVEAGPLPLTIVATDEEMRILEQIAEDLLNNPSPGRFLGAFRDAAPMISRLNISTAAMAHLFRMPLREPLSSTPSQEMARIGTLGTASLFERFSGLAIPAGMFALFIFTAAVSSARGGQGVSETVAQQLAQMVEGAREAAPQMGQAAATLTRDALVEGGGMESLSFIPGRLATGLAEFIRRNPNGIPQLLRNLRR